MSKIRSSTQFFVDEDLTMNGKKLTNLATAVADTDAVTFGQAKLMKASALAFEADVPQGAIDGVNLVFSYILKTATATGYAMSHLYLNGMILKNGAHYTEKYEPGLKKIVFTLNEAPKNAGFTDELYVTVGAKLA